MSGSKAFKTIFKFQLVVISGLNASTASGKKLVISELKAANTKGQGRLSLVSGPKASQTLGARRFFLDVLV